MGKNKKQQQKQKKTSASSSTQQQQQQQSSSSDSQQEIKDESIPSYMYDFQEGGPTQQQTEWLSSTLSEMPPEYLQQMLVTMMKVYSEEKGESSNEGLKRKVKDDDDDLDPVYDKMVHGLVEFQEREEKGLVEKKKRDDSGEYPIGEPMDWNKFFKSDFPTGYYDNLIDNNTFMSILQSKIRLLAYDSVCEESTIYYSLMINVLNPLGQDTRRLLVLQRLRRQGDNPRSNIRPETYSFYGESDFKICPSVEYLKKIITMRFIPKEKQDVKEDILEDKELVRCAKFVINSKKRRKKDFEEESDIPFCESFDTNNLDSEDYDFDSNDPENNINFSNGHDREKYREYKTEGATIRRLLIGSWSPCPCYDGQFRIKISPLFRKIYYRFFTFLPSYHNNFHDEEERDKYLSILTKAIASTNSCSQYLEKEIERLKNSTILSMEIDYSSITGIHLQKCLVDQRVFNEELCLLVLQVNQAPTFYSRKVKDGYIKDMNTKKRNDFTENCAASTSTRHFICGSEREMKRIASILIQSDTTGTLRKLYREGMKSIDLETEPVVVISSPVVENSTSSSPNNSTAMKMLNNYKLSADRKVLGECIFSHLQENFSQLLWEKLLTTFVREAANQTGIDLRDRGYSDNELDNLQLYQILGNEKFTKDIYFSFCRGRFYKTSEYHHVNGKCCAISENPTNSTTTTTATVQPKKTASNQAVLGTPFKFVNIGSVIEYPLPPNFPPVKKR